MVEFDPALGDEIRKIRPTVVISVVHIGILHVRIIVPLTDWKDRYALRQWMVHITPTHSNGLKKESAADCLQCRSVSFERFKRRVGHLAPETLSDLAEALAMCIGI